MSIQMNVSSQKIFIFNTERTQNKGRSVLKNYGKTLDFTVAKRMIQKLLIEQKITIGKLAEILEVSVKELMLFGVNENSAKLLSKINLPLIKIYCKTKWV